MSYDYMKDCIHLKACRRFAKIVKNEKGFIARGCDDKCGAYISRDYGNYVDVDEAISYARDGARSIESGYDSYDVFCSCDLSGISLGEIIDEADERRDK